VKPSQVQSELVRIATALKNSKKPDRKLVAAALKKVVAAVDGSLLSTTVQLKWLEPEPGKAKLNIPLSQDEVTVLIEFMKGQVGESYGDTVVSLKVLPYDSKVEPIDINQLATEIRYNSGEGIYSDDYPLFSNNGISRE
jgi:hypothetical protein